MITEHLQANMFVCFCLIRVYLQGEEKPLQLKGYFKPKYSLYLFWAEGWK